MFMQSNLYSFLVKRTLDLRRRWLSSGYLCALSLVSGTVQGLSSQIMSLNETSRTLCPQAPENPSCPACCASTAANDSTQEILVHFQRQISHWTKKMYSSVYFAKTMFLGWVKFRDAARRDSGKLMLYDRSGGHRLPWEKWGCFNCPVTCKVSWRFVNRRSLLPIAIKGVTC